MARLRLSKGELDLLAACPPCQGFSRIRTLNGGRRPRRRGEDGSLPVRARRIKAVKDVRNDLILEVLRFVRVMRPKTIMLENVPGLAATTLLDSFCKVLTKLGYDWNYAVLNAADYGVPQRRKRLILLASRHGHIEFAREIPVRVTVRDAIGSYWRAGDSGDLIHDLGENRIPRIRTLIRSIPKDGGSRLDLGKGQPQLKCHRDGFDGFKDVYGRMAWDDVSPTITSGCVNPSKGRFLHPSRDRAITLREAALLQSFPPGYRFSALEGKYRAAELIGNALPPKFVSCHANQVRLHLARLKGRRRRAA